MRFHYKKIGFGKKLRKTCAEEVESDPVLPTQAV
jgi:hypothetical protein